MAQQLRIYTMKDGRLDDWVDLFERGTYPLRRSHGFEIQAWTSRATNQFVWLVTREGTQEEFEAADAALLRAPRAQADPRGGAPVPRQGRELVPRSRVSV